MYHYKPDNITTKIHPHINRLKGTLYYLRAQIDEKEKTEAEIQRKKDIDLIETSKKAIRQSQTAKVTVGKLPRQNETKKTLTTVLNLDKKPSQPKLTGLQNTASVTKDEPAKDSRPLFYLLNELQEERDPVPFPPGKSISWQGNQVNLVEDIRIVKTNTMLDTLKRLAYKTEITVIESFYLDSQKYYEREFGFPLRDIPPSLLVSKEYKAITVERALNILRWFYLSPNDSNLFYHALLLDALPLPPDIVEVKSETGSEYHFNGQRVRDVLRPSYFYVKEVLEFLKSKTDVNRGRIDQFTLYDSVGRSFSINLRRIYLEWLRYPDHRHMINYTQLNEGIGLKKTENTEKPVQLSPLEKFRMENLRKIREIMGQNYAIELSTEITSSKSGFY